MNTLTKKSQIKEHTYWDLLKQWLEALETNIFVCVGKKKFAGNYMFSNKLNYSLTWPHFSTIFCWFRFQIQHISCSIHLTHRSSFESSAVLALIHRSKLRLIDFFFLAFFRSVENGMANRRRQDPWQTYKIERFIKIVNS